MYFMYKFIFRGRPHLDESLNIKQRDGMHAILSDSKSVDSKSQVPVLVTGKELYYEIKVF
jgi:hypothetical protein